MTTIVNHRVNSIELLQKTPTHVGVEVDIHPFGKKLVVGHEPFEDGDELDAFLSQYRHALLILNIKAEGIEREVLKIVRKHGITNYFFLDVTPPFMFRYMNEGWTQMACRFSEFEDIQTCLNLKGKIEWVFVDNLTHLPTTNHSFEKLKEHFKICIVSPELLKRPHEIPMTKELVKKYRVDAVLTDLPGEWEA